MPGRAGDRRALFLSAGEGDATLADHGFVSERKAFDIAGKPGHFGGPADLFRGGFFDAERDVGGKRGAEQERLLRHEADMPAQLGRIQSPEIRSVQQHRAAGGVEQPR